jgi:hypothetical protein
MLEHGLCLVVEVVTRRNSVRTQGNERGLPSLSGPLTQVRTWLQTETQDMARQVQALRKRRDARDLLCRLRPEAMVDGGHLEPALVGTLEAGEKDQENHTVHSA